MDQDKLTPELEKLLKQARLKEPPQELMANYLTGVNEKINQRSGMPHFGFPQMALVLVAGLVLAGLFYFVFPRPLNHNPVSEIQPVPAQVQQNVSIPPSAEPLSVEEEMAVLEAFEEEFSEGASDLFGDEELIEELVWLDELEISNASDAQVAPI